MKRPEWLDNKNIRPYVFARKANRPAQPGIAYPFDWFHDLDPLVMEPLAMKEVDFSNQIMILDQIAFDANGLLTPRWVFYDCAVMPGFITGFAARTSSLDVEVKKRLKVNENLEWTPLSLFIVIPTPETGRWMAHNLGSMNAFVDKKHKLSGLGFLSKAFALWYGNIRELYGVAQWNSPALKLHANYGPLEIVTAYTPIHDYANSITYRVWIDTLYWEHFLDEAKDNSQFLNKFQESGLIVEPNNNQNLIDIQTRIEAEEGPYYINPEEILKNPVGSALKLYIKK